MTDLIMCRSAFDIRKPDESYESEYKAALEAASDTDSIVNLFDIYNPSKLVLPPRENRKLIYHGWMYNIEAYEKFYNRCKSLGYDLINSPEQYKACHWFEGWYKYIEDLTAKSKIIPRVEVRPMMEDILSFMRENDCGVIIKDQVKSLKHNWFEACFIPSGADALHVAKVLATFKQLKEEYNDFQGDLVVRKFMPFKQIGKHEVSGMPLSMEFRTFVFNGELLPTSKYWDGASYKEMQQPPVALIEEVADRIFTNTGSNLFTVDVAQLEDNSWQVIEIGDGQVSALPAAVNKKKFFKSLIEG